MDVYLNDAPGNSALSLSLYFYVDFLLRVRFRANPFPLIYRRSKDDEEMARPSFCLYIAAAHLSYPLPLLF